MNRGSNAAPETTPSFATGFNEAPIHESGKCDCQIDLSRNVPGFNEAPIHESGKCLRSCLPETAARRFNEAPIHESGKCSRTAGLAG